MKKWEMKKDDRGISNVSWDIEEEEELNREMLLRENKKKRSGSESN
jgi:hypothetical protein